MTSEANGAGDFDLSKSSVILSLSMRRAGNRRRVSSSRVEVDADRDAISVSKELLASDEFKRIESFDGAVRKWVYSRALPNEGTLRGGTYRLPTALVAEVDAQLQVFEGQRSDLIEGFLEVYPERREEARERLRTLFDERDYPDVIDVRMAFRFDYRYMSFQVPGALESISADLLRREMEKAKIDVATEADEIKNALRASFAELLEHATTRLGVDKGKKRRFGGSMIERMSEFLNYFGARNIIGDDELATLVERARKVMSGVENPSDLRTDDDLRRKVRQSLTRIKREMDRNLEVRPVRKFDLGDDE